jgi:hypothetical protein
MPNCFKTCTNGHTMAVPIALQTCHCGEKYPFSFEKPIPDKLWQKCKNLDCSKRFQRRGRQEYCSPECQKLHYADRTRVQNYDGLSTGTIGSIGELRVCADLLRRGFNTFRAVSTNCWTDLVVEISSKFQSLEVKTGHRTISGSLSFPRPRAKTNILAIVLPNEIIYRPELPNNDD